MSKQQVISSTEWAVSDGTKISYFPTKTDAEAWAIDLLKRGYGARGLKVYLFRVEALSLVETYPREESAAWNAWDARRRGLCPGWEPEVTNAG